MAPDVLLVLYAIWELLLKKRLIIACMCVRGCVYIKLECSFLPVRLCGLLSDSSEMAPVVTVFFRRDAGATVPRTGLARASSLLARFSYTHTHTKTHKQEVRSTWRVATEILKSLYF